MLEFLAHNVGDHLSAAVANVVGPQPRHLERAVFADGLSPQAIAAAEAWVADAWRDMADALVPFIETADRRRGPQPPESARQQRFRAGLYAYTARDDDRVAMNRPRPTPESTAAAPPVPRGAQALRARRASARRQPD